MIYTDHNLSTTGRGSA